MAKRFARIGSVTAPIAALVLAAIVALVEPACSSSHSGSGFTGGDDASVDATAGDGAGDDGAAFGGGGNGGVGGEGLGVAVDGGTKNTLLGPATMPTSAQELGWLYPYDKTVWPRGMLAPLMQWQTTHQVTAVYVHLKQKYFEFQGFY